MIKLQRISLFHAVKYLHVFHFPVHMEELYCFNYLSSTETLPKSTAWDSFDMQAEFKRLNVPNDQWSITLLNKEYDVCIVITYFSFCLQRLFHVLKILMYFYFSSVTLTHVTCMSLKLHQAIFFLAALNSVARDDYQYWHTFITIK